MDYNVYLKTTPCNFGGVRWWCQCPLTGRTVAKLYLPSGAKKFASREAYRLPYQSQRDSVTDRTHARQVRLSNKLGKKCLTHEGVLPDRPKGMHKRTYERLTAELEAAIDAYDEAFTIGAMRILQRCDGMK